MSTQAPSSGSTNTQMIASLFFLIEIHAYKIGDSEPAPQFKIIEQPNDFAKIVKRISQDKGMNESQGCRLSFGHSSTIFLSSAASLFNKRKATTDHWYSVAVGSSECQISIDLVNKEHKIRVGLWIADNKERFDYMKQHKTEIEAAMGMALSWERDLTTKKSSDLHIYQGVGFQKSGKLSGAYE